MKQYDIKKYKVWKNEEKKRIHKDDGLNQIFINCKVNGVKFGGIGNDRLDEFAIPDECIFIRCSIHLLNISNIEKPVKITFVDCRIIDLKIENSHVSNIQFLRSTIDKALFYDSNLQGIFFSDNLSKYVADSKVRRYIKEKKLLKEVYLNNSRFLFCTVNNMRLDNTNVNNTRIKHCFIEDIRVEQRVRFKTVDLQGTKVLNSNLGKCKFNVITFHRGALLGRVFKSLRKIRLYFHFRGKLWKKRYLNDKTKRQKLIREELFELNKNTKKKLFEKDKNNQNEGKNGQVGKWEKIADWMSSTEFEDVLYGEADFSKDPFFCYYLRDLAFIHELKKRYPVRASIFFFFVGYLQSFRAIVIRAVAVILSSTVLYYLWGAFDKDIPEIRIGISPLGDGISCLFDLILLSAKVFANMGTYPFRAGNTFTDIAMVTETMFGYFYVGVLVAFFVYRFTRKDSMPLNKGDNN